MKAMGGWLAVLVLAAVSARAGEIDDILAKAKDGDMLAQIQAAGMYADGRGVAKNAGEAAAWYRKAAEQGSADAQLCLGKLHLGGKGMPKNSMEAAKWFLLAAEQGRAAAQIQMARMHLAGAGVRKDNVEACKWASLAAAQGDRQAKRILVYLLPSMTEEQTADAETLVREYQARKAGGDATKDIPRVAPPLE